MVPHAAIPPKCIIRLTFRGRCAYIQGMAKSPKDAFKIRRLPVKGQRLNLTVEVIRVAEPEGSHEGLVTLRVPGALAPITIPANFLPDDDA